MVCADMIALNEDRIAVDVDVVVRTGDDVSRPGDRPADLSGRCAPDVEATAVRDRQDARDIQSDVIAEDGGGIAALDADAGRTIPGHDIPRCRHGPADGVAE